MKLNNWVKFALVGVCFAIAIVGFMVKLPSVFRGVDKEMHTAFYFLAAAFLNILFAHRKPIIHAVIFALLYLFGVAIEYAQAYSNQFLRKKIHGRYDPEDVQANLKGLIFFSAVWIIYQTAVWAYRKARSKTPSAPESTISATGL